MVIAIISLLVSILLPSLQKAKELARQTVCQMNYRNIMTGYQSYIIDYDDKTPDINQSAGGYNGYQYYLDRFEDPPPRYGDPYGDWVVHMHPYTQEPGLFMCPSSDGENPAIRYKSETGYNVKLGIAGPTNGSSGGVYHDDYLGGGTVDVLKTQKVYPLDEIWCYADGLYLYWGGGYIDRHSRLERRHRGGLNVAYLDGHIQWQEDLDNSAAGDGPWNFYFEWD